MGCGCSRQCRGNAVKPEQPAQNPPETTSTPEAEVNQDNQLINANSATGTISSTSSSDSSSATAPPGAASQEEGSVTLIEVNERSCNEEPKTFTVPTAHTSFASKPESSQGNKKSKKANKKERSGSKGSRSLERGSASGTGVTSRERSPEVVNSPFFDDTKARKSRSSEKKSKDMSSKRGSVGTGKASGAKTWSSGSSESESTNPSPPPSPSTSLEPSKGRMSAFSDGPEPRADLGDEPAWTKVANASAPRQNYLLNGPTRYGDVHPCFSEGLLYRIVDGSKWAFYNDTQEYEMHASVTFDALSNVRPLGKTRVNDDGLGIKTLTTVVYPGETNDFMCGTVENFKSGFTAKPLSKEYRDKMARRASKQIHHEEAAITNLVGSADIDAVLDACVSRNIPFVDPEFPPCQRSLSGHQSLRPIPRTPWRRPADFLPKHVVSSVSKVRTARPNDVDRGMLGDTWLLTAMSTAAEQSSVVERLFRTKVPRDRIKDEEAVGAFRVMINKDGWWTPIILDSYLPTIGGRPAFAKNLRSAANLWVSLLEKAFAKAYGSYASIAAGDTLQGLHDITGFPASRFEAEWRDALVDDEKEEELFMDFRRLLRARCFPMLHIHRPAAMSDFTVERERSISPKPVTINRWLSVCDMQKSKVDKKKLVKVRFGLGDCLGDTCHEAWGPQDSRWEQFTHIARKCKDRGGSDGCFWMEWSDVLRHFDGGGACFSRPTWHDYRVRGVFKGVVPSVALEVNVTKPTQVCIVLSQKDKRGLPESDPNAKYGAIMVSVARKGDGGKFVVHSNSSFNVEKPTSGYTFSFSRNHAMFYTFTPEYSPYLVIPRLHEPATKDREFCIGLLSENPVGRSVKVRFAALDKKSRLFSNFPRFDYDPETAKTSKSSYQCTYANELPEEGRGAELPPYENESDDE